VLAWVCRLWLYADSLVRAGKTNQGHYFLLPFVHEVMMGTELMRICVKEDNDDFPSVPPGFESYTSFSLKRVENNGKQDDKNMISCSASTSASESPSTMVENDAQVRETAKVPRSLRRRPWINYGQYENHSEEDSDCERLDQVSPKLVHFFCLDFEYKTQLF